jgi:predicted transcriptional regulator
MRKDKDFGKWVDDAFDLARHVIENDELYPDRFVAIPASSPLVPTLFSAERRRLLMELKEHGEHDSIGDLAACVGRDATRVSRDLQILIKVGLVETKKHGKTKSVRATGRPVIIQ